MFFRKVFWIMFTLLLVGLCLAIPSIGLPQSTKNRFELDIDDYYNEDLLLYDPNEDFQETTLV